jgi:Spy/CpxP family protein refolding chaperone
MIEIKTAVLALTVAATGVAGLGALRAHAFHGGGHKWHGHHALMGRFVDYAISEKLREIGATDAQKQKVAEIKERLMRQGKALRDDHVAFHDELLELLSRDELDAAALRSAVKARTDAFARLAEDASDAVAELHGAFTPEQRARLLADLRAHVAEHHR